MTLPDHLPKCSATRSNGQPCSRFPTRGATVCAMHGGAAPQVRRAAEERLLDTQMRLTAARLGAPPIDNPLDELRKLAGQVLAWRDAVARMVDDLDEDELRYRDHRGAEQLRSEVSLLERAMDRCTHVLGTIARLNIDARLLALDEARTRAVVAAVDAAIRETNADTETWGRARRAAAAELRAIGSALPDEGA